MQTEVIMMKRIITMLLILTCVFGAAGCQKTPESPIVVGKDQQIMIEKAAETLPPEVEKLPLTERYAVKEHLEKSVTELDGKLVIEVDADISVPAVDKLPIVTVKPANFSQDTIYALFGILCGDTAMYRGRNEYTKAEIDEILVTLKKELAETSDEYALMEINDRILDFEKQYANAPENFEDVPADGTLESIEEKAGEDVVLGTASTTYAVEYPNMPYGSRGKTFYAYNNSDQAEMVEYQMGDKIKKRFPIYQASVEYTDERYYDTSWDCYWSSERKLVKSSDNMSSDEITLAGISPEQAIETAENLFTEAQIPLFVDHVIYVADESPFYEVNCSRQVNGANLVVGGEGTGGDGVAPYWAYERVRLWISADGIIYFNWLSPYQVMGTEVENATLMPFENIEDIFYKMMKTVYAPSAKDENSMTINVSDIGLKLHRIKQENSDTEGLLVPAWCFYGVLKVDEAIENEEMAADWERGYMPLLIVNAVDGSIIDLEKGY